MPAAGASDLANMYHGGLVTGKPDGRREAIGMAYNPHQEDYQRLRLRFAASFDGRPPSEALRGFATFGRRFAQDRDSLPQNDTDRAFHLVALATDVLDYQLPFVSEDQVTSTLDRGHDLLVEAAGLDARCFDAQRMLHVMDETDIDERHAWLAAREPEVRRACEDAAERSAAEQAGPPDGERAQIARNLALRPHRRWLYAMADASVICGRNREAIAEGLTLLDLDPTDPTDVRLTLALAYAKLEDEEGFRDELLARLAASPVPFHMDDAWMCLARYALAHKRGDGDAARDELRRLALSYPHAIDLLVRQMEMPDGLFSRVCCAPYGEDELVIAISEATVLLQEGTAQAGRGVLGAAVVDDLTALFPSETEAALGRQAQRDAARGGDPA